MISVFVKIIMRMFYFQNLLNLIWNLVSKILLKWSRSSYKILLKDYNQKTTKLVEFLKRGSPDDSLRLLKFRCFLFLGPFCIFQKSYRRKVMIFRVLNGKMVRIYRTVKCHWIWLGIRFFVVFTPKRLCHCKDDHLLQYQWIS